MKQTTLRVRHIYEPDGRKFEDEVNEALRRIVAAGGVVGDIKYSTDPTTSDRWRGGYGALIIYEEQGSGLDT